MRILQRTLAVVLMFLFSSCIWNFILNTKEQIVGDYYVIAADDESQATISIYNKRHDAYIGLTSEGIKQYCVVQDQYILGKKNADTFYLIQIGKESSQEYDLKGLLKALKFEQKDLDALDWDKV